MNAFDVITRVEEDELRFFETAGTATTDPEMKELFAILADNQKHHLDDLEKLKESMAGVETDTVRFDRVGSLINGLRRILSSRDILKELKDDPDAFARIEKAEDEMITLLKGMANSVPEEHVRHMLELLAEEEKGHLGTMESIYEFVEAPRSYLEWGEFSNLHPL